jgi:hypothetical protein
MNNEEIKKMYMTEFEEIATAKQMELDDVVNDFMELYVETERKSKGIPEEKVIKRTFAALDVSYEQPALKGSPHYFTTFGDLNDRSKDQNEALFKEIDILVKQNNIQALMDKGLIMTMKGADGKLVPVSNILKTEVIERYINDKFEITVEPHEGKIKELVITDGKVWTQGEPFILRDNRLKNGSFLNFKWSHELKHNYTLDLVGLAYPESATKPDIRLFEARVTGDAADPLSEKFIFKTNRPFTFYKGIFDINLKKTTSWKYVLKAANADFMEQPFEGDMDEFIDVELKRLQATYEGQILLQDRKKRDWIPKIYTLNNVQQMHDTLCDHDVNGTVIKRNGWDQKPQWNCYALLIADVEIGISKNKKEYLILKKGSMNIQINSFTTAAVVYKPFKLPGRCLLMVTTKRGPTRYDRTLGKKVEDALNGDIQISTHGYNILMSKDEIVPSVEDVQ